MDKAVFLLKNRMKKTLRAEEINRLPLLPRRRGSVNIAETMESKAMTWRIITMKERPNNWPRKVVKATF